MLQLNQIIPYKLHHAVLDIEMQKEENQRLWVLFGS